MKIKHFLGLTCAILVCLHGTHGVFAQDKVYYTVDLGFSISSFNQKNAPFPDPAVVEEFERATRLSLELGGNINYQLTDAITLSSGLRYTEKGGRYKTKNPNFTYVNSIGSKVSDAYNYLTYRLVYVEIPVLIKFSLPEIFNIDAGASDINIYGGVTGMLTIGSKFRYNVFSADAEESWESQRLKGAEDFLLSSVAGVEWSGGPIILYARYTKNIGDVYDVSETGYENFNVDMHTLSLGLGIIIN